MSTHTASKHVHCPACNAPDVRRSYPKGLLDKIMMKSGKTPLRCRRCEHRFYYALGRDDRLGRPDISDPRDAVL